jgi:uncharacterized protein YbjT (DUF2867 family)
MRVVVFGAAGQTGRLVVDGLVGAGHDVVGVVRSPHQVAALHEAGASTTLADLTQLAPTELQSLVEGCDAAIWTAGAGFGEDPQQIDGDACIGAVLAADSAGVDRWVQVSSMYADRPESGPPLLQGVLRAKHRSDTALMSTGLEWTVVRPGGLTNDIGTGQVLLGAGLSGGTVPRADVAAVAVACLSAPSSARRAFDLVSGTTPVPTALDGLAVE